MAVCPAGVPLPSNRTEKKKTYYISINISKYSIYT